jgi:DNA-binding GntR family transcriptional regulator
MRQTNIPKLTQIKTPTSLTFTTKEAIKKAIINGELEQGTIYSEVALASQWGISKTPIHNALVELSGKGFVTILPRKGFKVGTLTPKDMSNLFRFRRALEINVIDYITTEIDSSELVWLEKMVTDFENSVTIRKLIHHDRQFHEGLSLLTENQFFIDAIKNIWDYMEWLGASHLARQSIHADSEKIQGRVPVPRHEHREILEAIQRKNKVEAIKAMEKHLQRVEQQYLDDFKAEQETL